jgi:hypothetical protein
MKIFRKGDAGLPLLLVLASAMLPPVGLVGAWVVIPQFAMLIGGLVWAYWALHENKPPPPIQRDERLWIRPSSSAEWSKNMGYARQDSASSDRSDTTY